MGSFIPGKPPTPSLVSTYRDPDSTLSQRIKPQIEDTIALVMPNANPFTTISKHLRRRREVEGPSFDIMEKDEQPREVLLNATYTGADTTIVLQANHGKRVQKYSVLRHNKTGQLLWVSAVSTDTLTVTRSIGGGGQAMEAGDALTVLASAFEDASRSGDMLSVKEDRVWNYVQFVRTKFGESVVQNATALFGGPDRETEEKWHAIEHARDIENTLLFGKRHKLTGAGGLPVYFSGGLEYFIRTNVWDLGGNVPRETQWVEFLEEAMKWGRGGNLEGGGTKYFFCGARWQTVIESWGRDKIEYRNHDTILGLRLGEYQTAHGRVIIVRDHLLTGEAFGHYAFLVDMNHVRYVFLKGNDTKLHKNVQDNDRAATEDEFRTFCGLHVDIERSCAVAKNIRLG